MRLSNGPLQMMCASLAVLSGAVSSASASATDGAAGDAVLAAAPAKERVIIVTGRSERLIGRAFTANEGGLSASDLASRPLQRAAELLEAVPGLIAAQHSGGGKANQFFLRGFNLDHGTDFALAIDDMPMNFRTHGHGQGYLDVGGLIPEAVERIDYRKGPYRADAGDFAFVGSARITTRDTLAPAVSAESGAFGHRRLFAGGTLPMGAGNLMLMGQWKQYDGPWALPERLHSGAGLAKYTGPLGSGRVEASLSLYRARWQPTEQIPERAVGTFIPDRFGSLDPTLSGRTDRQVMTVNYTAGDLRVSAWGQRYDWSLFSNFTYFLDDPVRGDQLRQYERMWAAGGRIEQQLAMDPRLSATVGLELRHDAIGSVGLDHSVGGQVDAVRSRFSVRESSLSPYAEVQWQAMPALGLFGGLRLDAYRFHTRALAGSAWSGTVRDALVTRKAGARVRVLPQLALYASIGEGLHSNDARGVTAPSGQTPGLVRGRFTEAGVRFEQGGLVLAASHWWSRIGSELVYVGDSGAVEPKAAGRRRGYEATLSWRIADGVLADAVWSAAHARFADVPAAESFIPGALESSGEMGLMVQKGPWQGSIRLRYLGPHPLDSANSVRGDSTTLVNARAERTLGRVTVFADLLNLLNSSDHEIEYFYATRLPGEPAEGIEGRNSRVVEPRQLRIGVRAAL